MRRDFLFSDRTPRRFASAIYESGKSCEITLVEPGENKADESTFAPKSRRSATTWRTAIESIPFRCAPRSREAIQTTRHEGGGNLDGRLWSQSSMGPKRHEGNEANWFLTSEVLPREPRCWRSPARSSEVNERAASWRTKVGSLI